MINFNFKMFAIAALAAASTVTFAGVTGAVAQDPAYLAEYKLYSAALQSGDNAAAAAHGRAAWQAAETALGDDKLTAVLAYNYAQLVLFSDTADALIALRRANELQLAGLAGLPAPELRMMLAYAEFDQGGRKRKLADNLRDALVAFDETGATIYSAVIWGSLAAEDFSSKRYDDAIASAAKAEAAIDAAMPDAYQRKSEAILIGGAARLVSATSKYKVVEAAHAEFDRAISLFPPQKDLDSFDPIFAQALAWSAASNAALLSHPFYTPLDEEMPEDLETDEITYFEQPHKDNEECGLEWERKAPYFPNKAANRGYIGAAIVGYTIGNDAKVQGARVLAEVPNDLFGAVSVQSMNEWVLTSPLPDEAACRENRITTFTYVLED